MFGQVVETGSAVKQVKAGDYAVFTVRRGCGKCRPCAMNRSDMCQTGLYTERGISGMDGYQTEYVVDHEQYVVRVPPELEAVGVLAEPFSVAEKAITEAMQLQLIRLPDSSASRNWVSGKRRSSPVGPDWSGGGGASRLRRRSLWPMSWTQAHSPPRWLHLAGAITSMDASITPETLHRPDRVVLYPVLRLQGLPSLEFDLICLAIGRRCAPGTGITRATAR
jgi:hypothetical protein